MMTHNELIELYSKCLPNQVREEYIGFIELLLNNKVEYGLEIGVESGASLRILSSISKYVYGLDITNEYLRVPLLSNSELILDNALDKNVFFEIRFDMYKRGIEQLDFIFIDANDDYEKVKKIYLNCRNLVKQGGLIGFHDIAIYEWTKKFFDELEGEKYRFISDDPYGIGVLVNDYNLNRRI